MNVLVCGEEANLQIWFKQRAKQSEPKHYKQHSLGRGTAVVSLQRSAGQLHGISTAHICSDKHEARLSILLPCPRDTGGPGGASAVELHSYYSGQRKMTQTLERPPNSR